MTARERPPNQQSRLSAAVRNAAECLSQAGLCLACGCDFTVAGSQKQSNQKGRSAIRGNRWMFTILGAYKRRWAPCVQAHGPDQGLIASLTICLYWRIQPAGRIFVTTPRVYFLDVDSLFTCIVLQLVSKISTVKLR
ncbi:hypothetical protein F4V91_16390 [Neorhizobium galegae]|uniref:Uncharacterized protein n=1 Tax=Neorhizobium galegae TaxID=399 RepID=A0A6A1TTP7_NEOGA|nr:hypothetical protein F4V91_16390 [Neorhizobium galegae]